MRLLLMWMLAILALAGQSLVGSPAHAELPARPNGPILDSAGIIPDAEEAALDQKLRAYNQQTGRAVMVVTVSSLDGEDVRNYTVNLGHSWGLGGKSSDQGLILLVAPTERKLDIEVGYGLEQFMPDVLAGRIIRDVMVPRFKADDYPGGIAAGVDAIITQLNRDPADTKAIAEAAAAAKKNHAQVSSGTVGSAIFWIVLIVLLIAIFSRGGRRRGRRSGIDPGIVLWGISEAMHHANRGGGGWSSGGFGGGGSDWGGFGGGDFGGGGASGDW